MLVKATGEWLLLRQNETIKLYGRTQPALDLVQYDIELYDAYLSYRPTYR